MRHDGTSEIFAYWNNLRGTRAAPERQEISPTLMRSRLSDIFLLRAAGAAEARFRLAGTRVCSIYGRELKGQSFASIWQANDKPVIARIVSGSLTSKSVARLAYEGKSSRGRKSSFNLILLPLANEANERHLLGMIAAAGKPFWLESDAIIENCLRSVSIGDPNRAVPIMSNGTMPEATENKDPRPFAGNGRKVKHLRVFDGGKPID